MKCIYCLEDKPSTSYVKVEHVIPQSFGVFENNFTLIEMVCDDCNQYFGDTIENCLARDTLEGAYRFEYELKDPKDFKTKGKGSRIKIKILEGECKGAFAYREYSENQGEIILNPLPQIGFLRKSPSEYEYYLLDQIPEKKHLEENGFDLKGEKSIRILGADVVIAKKILDEKGFNLEIDGEGEPSESDQHDWLCEVNARVDDTIFRALAKISFNYLAYWEGKEFILHSSFDIARKFIRYGDKHSTPLVNYKNDAILGDEPVEGQRRLGHLITVDWKEDGVQVVSQVSLFNGVTYIILLSPNCTAVWRNIRRGNFFNTDGREIIGLEVR